MVKAYEIAEELNSLGIKTIVSSDIRRYVCLKAIVNAAINPLTAILKVRNGDLLKTEQARKLVETIVEEAVYAARISRVEIGIREVIDLVFKVTE